MATDKWLLYNGVEIVNLSRTAQLAAVLGIDTVWVEEGSVEWIQDVLGGVDYDDITAAPWYDPGYPASAEFAGIVPLSIPALDDSTLESTPIEYTTDGGHSGKPRNATLPIVASVALVASTDQGAEYGKRWMDRVLKSNEARVFCSGVDLTYFRYDDPMQVTVGGPPKAHRRDVRLTRGATITRKHVGSCSVAWFSTFTLTAADPFEYSEPALVVEALGTIPLGPGIIDAGATVLVETGCPEYDYTPIYDPLYPALVAPPTPPSFYPDGWDIFPGMSFQRYWVEVEPPQPVTLNVVPLITLTCPDEVRRVRVSVWASATGQYDQCDPLFSVVVSYMPGSYQQFIIDGEQKAAYVWDGLSPVVRRADSLVYSPQATPIEWDTFNDSTSLFITLDTFADSSGYEGDGLLQAKVELIQKSD